MPSKSDAFGHIRHALVKLLHVSGPSSGLLLESSTTVRETLNLDQLDVAYYRLGPEQTGMQVKAWLLGSLRRYHAVTRFLLESALCAWARNKDPLQLRYRTYLNPALGTYSTGSLDGTTQVLTPEPKRGEPLGERDGSVDAQVAVQHAICASASCSAPAVCKASCAGNLRSDQ